MISRFEIRISQDVCRSCKWSYSIGGGIDATHLCDYFLRTGQHRWAHDDGTCGTYEPTKRARNESQKRGNARSKESYKMKWDTERAFELWLAGERVSDIAREVQCEVGSITSYARHHWQDRAKERERNRVTCGKEKPAVDNHHKKWDKERAAERYAKGDRLKDIAQEAGISSQYLSVYASEHWEELKSTRRANGRLGHHERKWDAEKARQMYIEGWTQKEIGEAVGVSVSAISSYAAKHWYALTDVRLEAVKRREEEKKCRNKTANSAAKKQKRKQD